MCMLFKLGQVERDRGHSYITKVRVGFHFQYIEKTTIYYRKKREEIHYHGIEAAEPVLRINQPH